MPPDGVPGGRGEAPGAGGAQGLLQVLPLPAAAADGPHRDARPQPLLPRLLPEGVRVQGLRLWRGLAAAGGEGRVWRRRRRPLAARDRAQGGAGRRLRECGAQVGWRQERGEGANQVSWGASVMSGNLQVDGDCYCLLLICS